MKPTFGRAKKLPTLDHILDLEYYFLQDDFFALDFIYLLTLSIFTLGFYT